MALFLDFCKNATLRCQRKRLCFDWGITRKFFSRSNEFDDGTCDSTLWYLFFFFFVFANQISGGKISIDALLSSCASASNNNKKLTLNYRILAADENIWKVQCRWQHDGRFLLERQDMVERFMLKVCLFLVFFKCSLECLDEELFQNSDDSGDQMPSTTTTTIDSPSSSGMGSSTPSALRKISLSNVRSIGLSRRISRFGKSLTIDIGGRFKDT